MLLESLLPSSEMINELLIHLLTVFHYPVYGSPKQPPGHACFDNENHVSQSVRNEMLLLGQPTQSRIHSFILQNFFILVQVAVDLEPIMRTGGMSQENTLDGISYTHTQTCIHTHSHLGEHLE